MTIRQQQKPRYGLQSAHRHNKSKGQHSPYSFLKNKKLKVKNLKTAKTTLTENTTHYSSSVSLKILPL